MSHHQLVGLAAGACLSLATLAVSLTTAATAAEHPAAALPRATGATLPRATATATVPHLPPGWAATATGAIAVHGATTLGATPTGQRLRISVAMPLRHTGEIDQRIAAMSTPGSKEFAHFLTPDQVRARYGPTTATVAAVRGYLQRRGFTGLSVSGNRQLVTASASVGQVERAFHTHLASYAARGHRAYANTTPALVPKALAGRASAVLGLESFAVALPHRVARPGSSQAAAAGSPDLGGFTPKQIQKVYQATGLPAAKDTKVAVVAGGDLTPIVKHLRYAEKVQGFPQVPVKTIYTAPKPSITKSNPLTGNAEWDLDFQISTMEAQSVRRLDVYDIGTFTDPDVARAITDFVSDDDAVALSASLGECDTLAYVDGALVTTDETLAEGALQGQSMFASTGDNGSFCPVGASTGVPGGGPGQSWPAVGEYTTAVGGTTLLADSSGQVTQELAWVGGGGGVSSYADAGPWTYQANPSGQVEGYNNFGGRGVPDISADADPNTGVLIYTGSSKPEAIGGTSVSSPLVMGLWARMQGVYRDKLGLASNRFYKLYNKFNPGTVVPGLVPTYTPKVNPVPVPGYRDVVAGANGLYTAKPGYDLTTGVGTPLVGELTKQLGKGLSRRPGHQDDAKAPSRGRSARSGRAAH